jgi:hypothetical protein
MVRIAKVGMLALGALLILSAHASAQTLPTGIAGVVRDSSGGVLPGVTVEAASDALIEKVRTAVTDEQGQYKIMDLRSGTYTVTFTLTGFGKFRRENLELTSSVTAKVDAEMKIGTLEETVTVSGQAPVIDVLNASKVKVVEVETLFALPITKEMGGLAKITVGVMIPPTAQDVGGNIDPMNAYPVIHGGHTGDNRALLDGMQFNGEGQGRGFYFNPAAASEASVQLGGQTAEYENGGFQASMVPKEGGNHFSGLASSNWAGRPCVTNSKPCLINDNLSDYIKSRNLLLVNRTNRTYDGNVALGGPIVQDKLWFFTAHRVFGFQNVLADDFANLTNNTPFYTKDLSRPALNQEDNVSDGIRLTYQLAKNDKVNVSWDIQHSKLCLYCSSATAPEATPITRYANPNYLLQGKWSHVFSSKVFTEVADSTLIFNWPTVRKPEALPIPGNPLAGISLFDSNSGKTINAPSAAALGQRVADESNQRGSISYVTGSHAYKVGFNTQEAWHYGHYDQAGTAPGLGPGYVSYVFLNGQPSSLTEFAEPVIFKERLKVNLGLYGQDQWTMKRLTLNLGLRYDYFNAYVPAQTLPAGPFVPARNYDKVTCVPCWKDISPRVSAAYDLKGDGRTAIKVNVGRYVAADIYTQARNNNPVVRAVLTTNRAWTDNNKDFIPDCDLTNPNAQSPTTTGSIDTCARISNLAFGLNNPNNTTYSNDVNLGYGARSNNWQTSVTVDRQLRSNISVGAGYYRTVWGGFQVSQNTAVTSGFADYTPYCVTAPADSRLPNGGGYEICGLYDVNPGKASQVVTLVSEAPAKNGNQKEIYNGFDIVLNVRLQHHININGGLNSGRTETDNCKILAKGMQFGSGTTPRTTDYCDVKPPWKASTQVKFSGAIPLPYAFQVATTYQNLPAIPYTGTMTFTNAQVAASPSNPNGLPRDLSAGANATVNIPLIKPNSQYEKRIQQLDFRFSRTFKIAGGKRLEPQFDIYNALNASPILSVNNTYGTNGNSGWRTPQQILAGRLMKFGFNLTF